MKKETRRHKNTQKLASHFVERESPPNFRNYFFENVYLKDKGLKDLAKVGRRKIQRSRKKKNKRPPATKNIWVSELRFAKLKMQKKFKCAHTWAWVGKNRHLDCCLPAAFCKKTKKGPKKKIK